VYTVPYIWLYPLFIFIANLIFTGKINGIQNFSKTLAISLMMGYLLTETHEIANFIHKYLGLIINENLTNSLHPITNLYGLLVGYFLFKTVKFKNRIYPYFLGYFLILSSFIYYYFFYSKPFIPYIRIIQLGIFVYFINRGTSL